MGGVDLQAMQELRGCMSLAVVQRRTHLSQQHKRQAIELAANNFPYACHHIR